MKKILSLVITMLIISATPAYAKEVVKVEVNGLVCDFCVRTVEKIFGKKPEVSDIDVNLNTKIITIVMKDGKNLSDGEIKEEIVNAGYNVNKVSRSKS